MQAGKSYFEAVLCKQQRCTEPRQGCLLVLSCARWAPLGWLSAMLCHHLDEDRPFHVPCGAMMHLLTGAVLLALLSAQHGSRASRCTGAHWQHPGRSSHSLLPAWLPTHSKAVAGAPSPCFVFSSCIRSNCPSWISNSCRWGGCHLEAMQVVKRALR